MAPTLTQIHIPIATHILLPNRICLSPSVAVGAACRSISSSSASAPLSILSLGCPSQCELPSCTVPGSGFHVCRMCSTEVSSSDRWWRHLNLRDKVQCCGPSADAPPVMSRWLAQGAAYELLRLNTANGAVSKQALVPLPAGVDCSAFTINSASSLYGLCITHHAGTASAPQVTTRAAPCCIKRCMWSMYRLRDFPWRL